jgi:hypothetical protein
MGAALLLLGELGFVHVFIGGGRLGFSMATWEARHYFDVPDWGAMLGTSWRYFRSLPWLPMAPALAFFVAILGFNLFGYGLQRFIEKGRFHPSGWSVLRFFVIVALLLLGARSLLASTGVEAQFVDLARQFSVERAWGDIIYLTRPDLEGRPTGPGGGFEAAGYIAYQFEQAGLTTLSDGSYYQSYPAVCGRVTAEPTLEVVGSDGQPRLRLDTGLSFDPNWHFEAEGLREEELIVVGNRRAQTAITEIVLVLDPEETYETWDYPTASTNATLLHLVPDKDLARNDIAPTFEGVFGGLSFDTGTRFTRADLRIGETAARQLLAEAGLDLDELLDELKEGKPIKVETGLRVRVNAGLFYEEVSGANVIGYIPAADITTSGERILVAASYTGPYPPQLSLQGGETGEAVVYPGADDNASGVAVMLEVARLLHDLGFEPKRTIVFAAFDEKGENYFVNHPVFPVDSSDAWTAVILQGVGAGEPKLGRIEAGAGLARAFDQSARRFGVRTKDLDIWQFFFGVDSWGAGTGRGDLSYSGLAVVRPGDDLSDTPLDTLDHLDPELLSETGQTVAHYLMVLSSR